MNDSREEARARAREEYLEAVAAYLQDPEDANALAETHGLAKLESDRGRPIFSLQPLLENHPATWGDFLHSLWQAKSPLYEEMKSRSPFAEQALFFVHTGQGFTQVDNDSFDGLVKRAIADSGLPRQVGSHHVVALADPQALAFAAYQATSES